MRKSVRIVGTTLLLFLVVGLVLFVLPSSLQSLPVSSSSPSSEVETPVLASFERVTSWVNELFSAESKADVSSDGPSFSPPSVPIPTNQNVLCLYNSNSALSTEVCRYYLEKRPGAESLGLAIPAGSADHPWGGVMQTGEVMSGDTFQSLIIAPLLVYTADKPQITHLALAKDLPIAVLDGGQRVAAVPFINNPYGGYNHSTSIYPGGASSFSNNYLAPSANSGIHFNPELYRNASGSLTQRFVSSHLTGFTLEDIKALIDRAQLPVAPHTSWLLDRDTDAFSVYVSNVDNWKELLTLRNVSQNDIVLNLDESLLTASYPLIGYFGPGTYHAGYSKMYELNPAHFSFTVSPRAIYTTIESYSGFSALSSVMDHTNFSQSAVVRAFSPTAFGGTAYSHSFSGAIGSVEEPGQGGKVDATDYFLRNYAQGLTLAESGAWRVRSVETVFGDPLMRITDAPLRQPAGALCDTDNACLSGMCVEGDTGKRCQVSSGACLLLYPHTLVSLSNNSVMCTTSQNLSRCINSRFVAETTCAEGYSCIGNRTGLISTATCKLNQRKACTVGSDCVSGICSPDLLGVNRCSSATSCVIGENAMVDAEHSWWNCVPGTGQRKQCLNGQWSAPESCPTGCTYGQCSDTDTIAPTFYELIATVSSSQYYVRHQNYTFVANVSDARGVTSATLFAGGRAYAGTLQPNGLYAQVLTDVTVGNYSYYWVASDVANNKVTSSRANFTILPATPALKLLVNDQNISLTFVNGSAINLSVSLNVSRYEGNVALYHNTTLLENLTFACTTSTTYSAGGPVVSATLAQISGQYHINITWTGYASKTYQVKSSPVVTGPFTTFEGSPYFGNGSVISFLYPAIGATKFFVVEESASCPLDTLTTLNATLMLDHPGDYSITAFYTNGSNFLSVNTSLLLSAYVAPTTACTPGATLACPALADARILSGVNNTCDAQGEWTNINTCQYIRQADISLSNLTHVYDRTGKSALVSTTPSGLNVTFTYNGLSALPVAGGNYTVFAQILNESYEGNVTGRLEIHPALQSLDVPDFGIKTVFEEMAVAGSTSAGFAPTFEVVSGGETFEVVTAGDSLLTGNVINSLETRAGLLLRFWNWLKGQVTSAEKEVASVGLSPSTLANGTRIRFVQPGNLTLRVVQSGNENYSAALPVERVIQIRPERVNAWGWYPVDFKQTYSGLNKTVRIHGLPPEIMTNYTLLYNDLAISPINAGNYTVSLIITDQRFERGPYGLTVLIIEKAPQTITYTPASATEVGQTVSLQASASSGLPVTFAITNGPGTIAGNQLTVTGLGTIFFTISQPGNENYLPTSVEYTLNGACPSGQAPDQGTCRILCTSFDYTDWGVCSEWGVQNRTVLSASPQNCFQQNKNITQSCIKRCSPSANFGACPLFSNASWTGGTETCNAFGTSYVANNTCSYTCHTGFVNAGTLTSPLCVQPTTCTPDVTTACASLNHASVTGYANRCNALGTGFIMANGAVENTCVYRCDPRYHSNGTACVEGRTIFGKQEVRLVRETVGLFVFPNETNTSYIAFEGTFEEGRLGNLSITIESEEEADAYILVHNVSLRTDESKTIVVKAKRSRSNAVCIADRSDIFTKADIERRCFVLACPGTNGTYTCEKVDNRLIVTGLRHSGVIEDRIPVITNTTTPASQTTPSDTSQREGTRLPGVAMAGTTSGSTQSPASTSGTSVVGSDAPIPLEGEQEESTAFATRLAQIFAGGNETLLYLELGFFGLIVVLLIVFLFAYSHFARQSSETRAI